MSSVAPDLETDIGKTELVIAKLSGAAHFCDKCNRWEVWPDNYDYAIEKLIDWTQLSSFDYLLFLKPCEFVEEIKKYDL